MKTTSDLYFKTLINSFKTVIHNKALWFFAIFTVFLGTGQWFNYLSNDFLNILKSDGLFFNLYKTGIFTGGFLKGFLNKAATEPFSFIMVFLIFLTTVFLIGLLIWISVSAQGGLIYSISEINKGKKIDIRNGLYVGRSKFWQVFSLNFIVRFFMWTLSILVGVFNYMAFIDGYTNYSVILSVFSVIIILFLLLLFFVFKYSLAFIMLKGQNAVDALKSGFKLFFDNWILSLEVGLFLFIIDYLFVYLFSYGLKLLLIPINVVGGLSISLDSAVSFGFYIIFVPILFSMLILFIFSVLIAYNFTVWTTVFTGVTGGNNKISGIIDGTVNNMVKKFKKYE